MDYDKYLAKSKENFNELEQIKKDAKSMESAMPKPNMKQIDSDMQDSTQDGECKNTAIDYQQKDKTLEIDDLCQRLIEYIDDEKTINKLNILLQENPKIIDALRESMEDIEQEKDLLLEFEVLKKYDLPQEKISQRAFENFIDDVFSGDLNRIKQAPNVIYLNNLNIQLTNILNLNNAKVYLLKNDLHHSRPQRKQKYNQNLPIEILKNMQSIIEKAQSAYIDKGHKNFFIAHKLDNGLAIFTFSKDKDGNFVIHTKKTNEYYLRNKNFMKVSPTGFAPAIPPTVNGVAATSLQASSDTSNETIPQNSSECQEQNDSNDESNESTHKRRKP